MRDTFAPTLVFEGVSVVQINDNAPQMDCDIEILPLGTKSAQSTVRQLIFRKWEDIIPKNYTEEDLAAISQYYWQKQDYRPGANQLFIDFRELEHVYELLQLFFELGEAAVNAELESNLPELMATLDYYIKQADLTDIQREILDMKLKKVKNVDVALEINKKWGKSYTPNYISTIFRQRIIPRINEAAAYHKKLVGKIFFEEEFKTCTGCGRTLLRDTDNFTRKNRSKDGYTSRCKQCEKNSRLLRTANDMAAEPGPKEEQQ